MRPLLQIKLPREPRGGVTAASGTVICPPRAARVYTYVQERGGRFLSLSLSLVSGEKRSWNQMPVALDTGFMVVVLRQRCDLYRK